MELVTGYKTNNLHSNYFKSSPIGSFRIAPQYKKSKTIDFFNDLYTYPPKFRVKWDVIDELHQDSFTSYNYRVIDRNFTFREKSPYVFQNEKNNNSKQTQYSIKEYIGGYLNKLNSTKFYGKKTKPLQKLLKNIPIYTILNGQGEIILNTSTDSGHLNTTTRDKVGYLFCGNFDPIVEQTKHLGLFFISKKDAELYLTAIAKSDVKGTSGFGLSIHCFSLDFAYRILQEYHPNIDFRFIPDSKEIQDLLTNKNTGSSTLIFDGSQQQLRIRKRSISKIPILPFVKNSKFIFSSFLNKTDYFKGVPIYIVNVEEIPSNLIAEKASITINLIDGLYGRSVNIINALLGLGNSSANYLIEGNITDQKQNPVSQNYVFFERDAAINFCKIQGKKINKYNGGNSKVFKKMIKKPNIFVYNLEDFLETWEDQLLQTENNLVTPMQNSIFNKDTTKFIPPKNSSLYTPHLKLTQKRFYLHKISQYFKFKYQRFNGFLEFFLNAN